MDDDTTHSSEGVRQAFQITLNSGDFKKVAAELNGRDLFSDADRVLSIIATSSSLACSESRMNSSWGFCGLRHLVATFYN
jgi:hypothetical protein